MIKLEGTLEMESPTKSQAIMAIMEDEFMCLVSLLGSQGCTAYDVVINQEFFQKCKVCVCACVLVHAT